MPEVQGRLDCCDGFPCSRKILEPLKVATVSPPAQDPRIKAALPSTITNIGCQKAQYGPVPPGVLRDSIAVKTLRPKKKGRPQSKVPGFGAANPGKTFTLATENRLSAFCTANITVSLAPPDTMIAERDVLPLGQ